MTPLLEQAQHFVRDPHWTWYILFYFFFAGISGGSYVIATLFRLRGEPADEPAARIGYYVAFAALPICPILLILDLGSPLRFWHMMWDLTPGDQGLILKLGSPMSVGVWALLVYGAFATVSFVDALVRDGKVSVGWIRRLAGRLTGMLHTVVMVLGAVLGLFIAGYTGVLLSVSNQPVWSDSWALGGLFLASGLSGSAALLLFLLRYRETSPASADALVLSERLYAALELLLIVVFLLTLIPAGAVGAAFGFPWLLLWLVAFAGLVPGIAGLVTSRLTVPSSGNGGSGGRGGAGGGGGGGGSAVAVRTMPALKAIAIPALVLLGVLFLRAAVIFAGQHS